MASQIHLGEQFLFVSNYRLSSLIEFALDVGTKAAATEYERECVEQLRQFSEQAWLGINFDLNRRFQTIDEKRFWAGVFRDVARRIFLRQLGNNHVISFWQSSAIGDSYIIARMLTRAVQEIENGWHPRTDDSKEAEAFFSGPIHIRV